MKLVNLFNRDFLFCGGKYRNNDLVCQWNNDHKTPRTPPMMMKGMYQNVRLPDKATHLLVTMAQLLRTRSVECFSLSAG